MTEREAAPPGDGGELIRHEEDVELGKAVEEARSVRARKRVDTERAEQVIPRQVEHVDDVERVAATDSDSGEVEILADGSVSIPVFEEELVVTKRLVVRERVVIRKRTETEHRRVEADVRKERVELEAEGDAEIEHEAPP
jgi:uncharacterized protein (TIGR02271 family)